MSKTKATTKGDSAKASKKDLKTKTGVKEGRITKPAQTPKAKSKEIAKAVVAREDKKQKKSKKAPTPEPESESDSESSASESEANSDSSDEEVETKASAKVKGAAKAKAESDDDTSDSSASSEDDSEDDSESDSEEEAAPKAAPKANGVKLNGAAKPAAKAAKSESESDSDSDSSESESEDEKPAAKAKSSSDDDSDDSDDSDSGSDASSDSDESEAEKEEVPSKKRKADAEPEEGVKKSKTETGDAEEEGVKNLFVGNLSWNIDEEWLQREFESFGEITGVRIITDRETGRAKGFGYVEFATAAAAKKAQAEMHQYELDGRPMNVDFSTPRQNNNPKDKANDRANKFGDKRSPPSNTLFIGGVSFNSTNESIGEVFGEYGTVNRVSLPTDRDTGNPKGFGYVEFGTVEEATAALESLNGSDVDGRTIRVDFAGARDNSNGGGRGGGFGGRGGRGGGRGGFGDRGGRGGGRGGFGGRGGGRGGRGGSTNRGGFSDFKGQKMTF